MTQAKQTVGIVGATGAVGVELIRVLGARQFSVATLRLFASASSVGQVIETPFGKVTVEEFSRAAAGECDLLFLAVSGGFAREHAEALAEKSVVIDNSAAFRLTDGVPLVVPEINPAAAKGARLIANPNCTTILLALALAPLHAAAGLKRVIVSTYQAASGAGAAGMAELNKGVAQHLANEPVENKIFTHPLPFNVIPHIDTFQPNGYTREEMKVVAETRKIMTLPDLAISCTAVRIPTLRAHAEAITVELERPLSPTAARKVFSEMTGLAVVDNPAENLYPMPLTATGKAAVEIGRIRQSLVFGKTGLDFFLCGDQLLKGAALNAVQIAEILCHSE